MSNDDRVTCSSLTFTCVLVLRASNNNSTTNSRLTTHMIRTTARFSCPIRHASSSSRVLVVGTGTGGLAVSSKLSRSLPPGCVTLLDNRLDHYNQPLFTLVGAGIKRLDETKRKTETLIPKRAKWICESAVSFDPEKNSVVTSSGDQITYDYLVLSLGINLDFDSVPGLVAALNHDKYPVCSNYSSQTVEKTWWCFQNFSNGNAVFSFPNSPVKCAGAPQKVMYLFDDYLRKKNMRSNGTVSFHTALPSIFSAPKYAGRLLEAVKERSIQTFFRQNLVKVDGGNQIASFEDLDTHRITEIPFNLLHVTPPQSAPKVLKPFGDAAGFVDIDKHTMQSKIYKNVFALGDCCNAPTSKTAAAISSQSHVLAENLLSLINGKGMRSVYDGYTSCPLVMSYKTVMLAEFDYELKPKETFFFDQGKERGSMFLMKRDIIPQIYWHMLLT